MGNSDGTTNDFYSVSSVIYAGVIVVTNLKAVLDTSTHDVVSVTLEAFGIISYIISVFVYSSDYILSKSIVIKSFVLDNITMIVFNSKFFLCLLGSCTICYFIEIVCNKYPVLFGCVIEGKNLPPYKEERKDKNFFKKYSNYGDEEILCAYSQILSKSSSIHYL